MTDEHVPPGQRTVDDACTRKLTVDDSFLPENAGSTLPRFQEGWVEQLDGGAYEVEVSLDISEFSSLLVGTVDFESLYHYGLAEVSDADYVDTVTRIFAFEQKPMCLSQFQHPNQLTPRPQPRAY